MSQNNNISLMDVLEQLNVDISSLPAGETAQITYPFDLVTLWQREGDSKEALKGEVRTSFVDWKGETLLEANYQFEIPQGKKRGRAISQFPQGIPIKRVGNHRFLIELKQAGEDSFKTVGEIPLEIRQN